MSAMGFVNIGVGALLVWQAYSYIYLPKWARGVLVAFGGLNFVVTFL